MRPEIQHPIDEIFDVAVYSAYSGRTIPSSSWVHSDPTIDNLRRRHRQLVDACVAVGLAALAGLVTLLVLA